jgi:hypothetical protein
MRWPVLLGATLTAGIALPAPAQVIDLRLRDDATRFPVAGAIVRLLQDDVPVAQGLTSELGRIVLQAPQPGAYRVRVDRIGFRGIVTGAVELAAGDTLRSELVLAWVRMELPAIVVRGETRCDARRQEGPEAVALWEEVRKALTANLLSQGQGTVPIHVRAFYREVARTGAVEKEWVTESKVVHGQPFGSLAPAELAQFGFVRDWGDSVLFAGPDARLLLSDEFVSTHCFRAVPGEEGLVGLAFEPVPGRRVPDVRGTLWLDRTTSELRYLEYLYTGLRAEYARVGLGGRVEFQRLPDGSWIVSYWHIRTPRTGVRSLRARTTGLIGFLDEGGYAEAVTADVGPVRAIVRGMIYDSTTGRGLAGAVVRVVGAPDSAITDGEGLFELAVRAAGDQRIAASHPKLDLSPAHGTGAVFLSLGDTTVVHLAGPPVEFVVRVFCGAPRNRSGLVGMAWHGDGAAAEGLTVRVEWQFAGGVLEPRSTTGPGGFFALCELPTGADLPVRLERRGEVLAEQTVRLRPGEYRWVDLRP